MRKVIKNFNFRLNFDQIDEIDKIIEDFDPNDEQHEEVGSDNHHHGQQDEESKKENL